MQLHKPKMSCRSFICGQVDAITKRLARFSDSPTRGAAAKLFWWDGNPYMTHEQSQAVRSMWTPFGTDYERDAVCKVLHAIGYPMSEAKRRTSTGACI